MITQRRERIRTVLGNGVLFGGVILAVAVQAETGSRLSEKTHRLIPGVAQIEDGSLDPEQVIFDFANLPLGSDPPELTAALEELTEKYPRSAFAYARLAGHYATNRRCDEMARIGAQAMQYCPDNIFVLGDVGLAYGDCGEFERGRVLLMKAVEVSPNSMARYNLARLYCNAGKYELCLQESQEYIQRHRDAAGEPADYQQALVESYNNVGVCLTELGKPKESFTWFEEALKLDPQNTRTQENYQWAKGKSE